MANLTEFWFEPGAFSIRIKESYQPKIMGRFDDGTTMDITGNSSYLSNPVTINTGSYFGINRDGVMTAYSLGKTYVKAWGNIYTLLSAYYGKSASGSAFTGISGTITQSDNLTGYPAWGAWTATEGSGNWAPANARSIGVQGGWLGYSFYSATKVQEVQYEPHRDLINGSITSHYVEALINGTWRTYYPQAMGQGVFSTRYRATINEVATAIRIWITGYSSIVGVSGPMISILRPFIMGFVPGYQTKTIQADVTITGYPNEITVDPSGNPDGTEYTVQASEKSDFSAYINTIASWTKDKVVTEELADPTIIRYYRAKARNSKGVETDWSPIIKMDAEIKAIQVYKYGPKDSFPDKIDEIVDGKRRVLIKSSTAQEENGLRGDPTKPVVSDVVRSHQTVWTGANSSNPYGNVAPGYTHPMDAFPKQIGGIGLDNEKYYFSTRPNPRQYYDPGYQLMSIEGTILQEKNDGWESQGWTPNYPSAGLSTAYYSKLYRGTLYVPYMQYRQLYTGYEYPANT